MKEEKFENQPNTTIDYDLLQSPQKKSSQRDYKAAVKIKPRIECYVRTKTLMDNIRLFPDQKYPYESPCSC